MILRIAYLLGMVRFLIFYILFFPVTSISQTNEGTGIFIYDHRSAKTKWIDDQGRYIKTFDKDHVPKLNSGKLERLSDVFALQNFNFHHFKLGHLPVRYKDTWQFYNETGKLVVTLDKPYADISLATQGYFVATVKDSLQKEVYIYIDAQGKELFQGRVFSETTEFRKHIAFGEQDDQWYILNGMSDTCTPLENETLQPIHSIKRNTSHFSHVVAGPPNNIEKYLIDTLGQIVYSAKSCGGQNRSNIVCIDDAIIICAEGNKGLFYDLQGKLLSEQVDMQALDKWGHGLLLITMRNGEKRLFDYSMNPVALNTFPGETYTYTDMTSRFLTANVQNTITHDRYLGFFDRQSKTKVYRMGEDNFGGLIQDKIIYANYTGWKLDLIALVSLSGDIVYAEKNKDSIYNLAVSRYFPKPDVKGLLIINDENIESLPAYKHVESLEFQFCQFDKLPECICGFQQLKSITVNNCTNLVKLPDCLGRLPHFNDLLIKDCTSLSTLEGFLMRYPKTLVINTHGHYFSEGFNKVIEEKLPHIKLSSWTDNWFYNDTD